MELAIVGGLTALGYYLSDSAKSRQAPFEPLTVIEPELLPNGPTHYDSGRYLSVRQYEHALADKLNAASHNPWETGVVPPFMNSEPHALVPLPKPPVMPPPHNNFQPFFGARIKQNTNPTQNEALLETFTGTNRYKPAKQEIPALFTPEERRSANPTNERDLSRYVPSRTYEAVKPFQPIRVGPGLNQGPTSAPSGGFQDMYRAPLKDVDELRVTPKMTYAGRILPAQAPVAARGMEVSISKNAPERMRELQFDDYFRTKGAITGNTQRPIEIVKPTHRLVSKSVQGVAGPAAREKPETRPGVQPDRRQSLINDGPRNASASDNWSVFPSVMGDQRNLGYDISDYGKAGIANPDNERTLTGCRTYTSNVRDAVGRETAPLADAPRDTRKQDFVTFSRKGNVKSKGIGEHPVENWVPLETTLKDTLLHDCGVGNLRGTGADKMTVRDPADVPRRTLKETLLHDPALGNVDAPKTSAIGAIDKDEYRLRSTLREKEPWRKFGSAPQNNVLTGNSKQICKYVDTPRTTLKETLNNDAELTNFVGSLKAQVRDPEDLPRTTIKETVVDASRVPNVQSDLLQAGDAYLTTPASAPPTNRQFSSHEYFGDPGTDKGQGHLTTNPTAKTTMRQSYSDESYIGPAESAEKAETNAEKFCNARINQERENLLRGRAPTQQSVKLPSGEDAIHVKSNHLLPQEITRAPNTDRGPQLLPSSYDCMGTRQTNKTAGLSEDRLDTGLIQANPLHVPLSF